MPPADSAAPERCPCLSGETYANCCGRYHRDGSTPPTAELLMRSRYSAFAVGDVPYLMRTWHPLTRPAELEIDDDLRWTRLDIERTERGGLFDTEGVVEFTAYGRENRERVQQHETSRFVRVESRWVYLDAVEE